MKTRKHEWITIRSTSVVTYQKCKHCPLLREIWINCKPGYYYPDGGGVPPNTKCIDIKIDGKGAIKDASRED
jgi:hypothetical protein